MADLNIDISVGQFRHFVKLIKHILHFGFLGWIYLEKMRIPGVLQGPKL